MIARLLAAAFLASGSVIAEDHEQITMSSPFINERGDVRATITNNSGKEIQIFPSQCNVETQIGETTRMIAAKDPAIISLISLKIPLGEAKDFSFDLIPGLMDVSGEIRLFVHAVSIDPLDTKIVKSELFEISNLKSNAKSKPGANPTADSTR